MQMGAHTTATAGGGDTEREWEIYRPAAEEPVRWKVGYAEGDRAEPR